MKAAIEIVLSVLLITAGYIGTCLYMKNAALRPFSIKDVAVDTKWKIVYLAFAVAKSICIIALFNTVHASYGLVHQLKLLTLIECILPMAVVDLKKHKIPNQFLLIALSLRAVFYIVEFAGSASAAFSTMKNDVVAAVVISAFFLLISLIFKNSIGMGDIKLFAVMGLYQGLWGAVNAVFFSLVASFFLSLVLLITKRKGRKDMIAFGPSILLGTIVAIGLSGI